MYILELIFMQFYRYNVLGTEMSSFWSNGSVLTITVAYYTNPESTLTHVVTLYYTVGLLE